jgi:hypothetical protein
MWRSLSPSIVGSLRSFTLNAQIAASSAYATVSVLPRGLDALSDQFKASLGNMETLMGDMQQVMQTVHAAGGDKTVSRHRSRNKWLPRERINMLLDPGSPFLELSPLAGHKLYGEPPKSEEEGGLHAPVGDQVRAAVCNCQLVSTAVHIALVHCHSIPLAALPSVPSPTERLPPPCVLLFCGCPLQTRTRCQQAVWSPASA